MGNQVEKIQLNTWKIKFFSCQNFFTHYKYEQIRFQEEIFIIYCLRKKKQNTFFICENVHWISHLDSFVFTSGEKILIDFFFNSDVWKQVDF